MWNPFTRRNLFSAKRHNEVANIIDAIRNMKVVRGGRDQFLVSASNSILELKQPMAGDFKSSDVVTVKLCDPATGEVKTYELVGKEV